jgi:hypothetical protein
LPHHLQAQMNGKPVRCPPNIEVAGIESKLCTCGHIALIDDDPIARSPESPESTSRFRYNIIRIQDPSDAQYREVIIVAHPADVALFRQRCIET